VKFSINRLAFISILNTVQRAIAQRTTIPILTGLKIDVTREGLWLTGSDADLSIEAHLEVSDPSVQLLVEKTGAIVLPARFFIDFIKKLSGKMVSLSLEDDNKVSIVSDQARVELFGIDAQNYPHLPQINTEESIELSGALFKQLVNQTIVSVSTQESRPILTGVHFTITKQSVKAVATDAHRLSQRIVKLDESVSDTESNDSVNTLSEDDEDGYDVIVPSKSLVELIRTIEDDEDIRLMISENQILFQTTHFNLYSRLLEGNYPDTDRLIPESSNSVITINSNQLLQATDRASLMAHHEDDNAVKLTIMDGNVELSSYASEMGNVTEKLECEAVTGENITITFNPDYLKAALKTFDGSDIVLNFIASTRPFYMTPKSEDPIDKAQFIHLITPIRTN